MEFRAVITKLLRCFSVMQLDALRSLGNAFCMHPGAIRHILSLMPPFELWLTSTETGKAFSHCIRCKLPLLEIASPWMINKDFHKGECTLEYAI